MLRIILIVSIFYISCGTNKKAERKIRKDGLPKSFDIVKYTK